MPGHGPSTVPVVIPASSSASPPAAGGRPMTHQTSSSLASSEAEVAELAGCSVEDSIELKQRAVEQQTVAKRTIEESASRDGSPSTEEDVNEHGTCKSQRLLTVFYKFMTRMYMYMCSSLHCTTFFQAKEYLLIYFSVTLIVCNIPEYTFVL